MTSAGPTFADLVAVAAVGTAQRPLPPLPEHLVPPGPADQSAATRLLDAAAAFAVVRRARLPVEHGLTGAATAPDDSGDPPPPRFVAALARALHLSPVESPPGGAAQADALLAESLTWVGQAGWRLPHRLVVPLLQRCSGSPSLTAAAESVLGPRGRWLAELNPAWAAIAAEGSPPRFARSDETAWTHGTSVERRAFLTELRRTDPDRARELLAATWSQEEPSERIVLLGVLTARTTPGDEDFLTAATHDRSPRVAEAARWGLLSIEGSALLERLRLRARRAVTVWGSGPGASVWLTAPDDDGSAVADGLGAATFSATPGENRLNALVAAIPPREWPGLAGVTASQLVAAGSAQSFGLSGGLTAAAVRWRDAELAAALVRAGDRTPALLALLDPEALVRLLDDPAAALPPTVVRQVVDGWPRPWPPALARSLGGWIQRQVSAREPGWATIQGGIWDLAASAAPIAVARGWAGRFRELGDDPRVPGPLQRRAHAAAGVLLVRAGMYDDVRAALESSRTAGEE